ncbi:MAG TPA: hypothetical protein VE218_07900, partial [Acidobacteriaceae bacterium]|nr:hypothetical protein [Acidobacteriaceae bacterium]
MALTLSLPGCHSSSTPTGAQSANAPTGDPSDVNAAQTQSTCPTGQMLMSDGSCAVPSQVAAAPAAGSAPAAQAPAQSYAPAPAQPSPEPASGSSGQQASGVAQYAAPLVAAAQQYVSAPQYSAPPPQNESDADYDSDPYYGQSAYDDQSYQQDADDGGYEQGYEDGIAASQPPPELPVYEQPPCPGPGYIWNPGYWGWGGNGGYYWVPGVWVLAPYTGALWTPGWWGFLGGAYRWHSGYWGSHVGFYGGVPYGYGYTGSGYHGGYWNQDRFMYNRSVNNINTTNITNVYNTTVINRNGNNRVSYNGGRGGLNVRPTQSEFNAMREQHLRPLPTQIAHRTQAQQNRQQYATVNRGRPAIAVAARPLPAHHVNVAPTVVNPGVHGVTHPAPAVARPQPGVQPGTRPNQPETRPGQPAVTTPAVRPNEPVRPNT